MYLDNGSLIRRLVLAHSRGMGSLLRVLVSAVLMVGSPVAGQSQSGQEVPTVEPPLSRLYGSDDLDFGGLFMSGAISPDGRWLVFSRAERADGMNLWIVPLDGTGDAARLTTGAYWDAGPLWFPSGDRILFRSSRADPGGDFQFLMTLDIDPSSGQASGLPRQLTLEPVMFTRSYDISPDGEQVVYVARPTDDTRDELEDYGVKILPARGGQARTVWTQGLVRPIWADDGFIYGMAGLASAPDAGWDRGFSIRRVPAAGGEAEILSNWPTVRSQEISADARTFVYRLPRRSGAAAYEVASVHGQRLARFTLPDNMLLAGCSTRDVSECLAKTENATAPLKVIPINGGPTRQLTESQAKTWPIGWTPDGREVVFVSKLDGTRVMMSAPVTGGVMEELSRRPQEEWVYGPSILDARHIMYGAEDESDGTQVLRILDLHTGSEREITRTPWVDYTRYNASRTEDRFLYAERKEGRFEFRAVDPEGGTTLLRAFPDTTFPPIIGVHGDRIAYWTDSDGRSTLYLAQAGQAEALSVLTFPGSVGQRGTPPPTWSPDGRHLATGYWRPETNGLKALVVDIDESGEVLGDPLVVEDMPEDWWNLRWMPDNDAFLVSQGDVWLASIRGEGPPVNLTQEEPGTIWSYALSPDGRYIAVSPEVSMGGSIWRVDLEEVLAGYRQ